MMHSQPVIWLKAQNFMKGLECEMVQCPMERPNHSTLKMIIQQCQVGLKAWNRSSGSVDCGGMVYLLNVQDLNVKQDKLTAVAADFFSVNLILSTRNLHLKNLWRKEVTFVTSIPSIIVN